MSLLRSQHLTTVKAMIKQNLIFYSVQKERERFTWWKEHWTKSPIIWLLILIWSLTSSVFWVKSSASLGLNFQVCKVNSITTTSPSSTIQFWTRKPSKIGIPNLRWDLTPRKTYICTNTKFCTELQGAYNTRNQSRSPTSPFYSKEDTSFFLNSCGNGEFTILQGSQTRLNCSRKMSLSSYWTKIFTQ